MEHTGKTRRPGGERGWMVGLRIDEWTRQEKYFRYEIIFLIYISRFSSDKVQLVKFREVLQRLHRSMTQYYDRVEANNDSSSYQGISIGSLVFESRAMDGVEGA